ncbi:MAG TPA: helicase-related protein [Thermoflexus sp.]|nr:helicase-related protein [Thermoflexus sp.]
MKPGSIVRFRNRDWVLLPSDQSEVVLLRPLTGTSDDVVAVHRCLSELLRYTLPSEGISPSQFPLPSADSVADAQSVHLLWQAARLLLREGATPFRSLGRISVRPRTYQLVPLMMALRLNPVRMLIADDVGVGKTIEAGLIIRELWEQGEICRLAVLCPPYLCDQWQKELSEKFHLDAVVIGSGTIGQLERRTPPGRTVYEHYPVQIISIDFVKHERNKHAFLLQAPELVVVDEAHGVTGHGPERHLRYELVRELAKDPSRHLILLTATPHSGIPEAFQRLLGLLHPQFATWDLTQLKERERAILAQHFVQRTRKDIEARWEPEQCFPKREPMDATYTLSPAYRRLFQEVYEFCQGIVYSGQALQAHRRRMRWWSALALLRCVMSSPRAAKAALERRRKGQEVPADEEIEDLSAVYEPDNRLPADEVPTPLLSHAEADLTDREQRRLRELERMAEAISEAQDHKLTECIRIVRGLLRDGFHPVVWCYYVETAEYVAEKLQAALAAEKPEVRVLCLTGRVSEEERRLKVEEFMREPVRRVLVATDCLSEGINLQKGFNAVVHYDLPWNPNRLEQREGRVDRYEQQSPVVRAVRFYGKDNPVDGAVIRVLLDKAREIRESLGTHVPVPEEEQSVVEALVHALFFGRERPGPQLPLALEPDPIPELHRKWELDARREKESRTRFAQHALKPEEVRRELEATDQVLGDPEAVRNFVLMACQLLQVPVRPSRQHPDVWEILTEPAALSEVPEAVRRALPPDRRGRWAVTFTSPTPPGAEYLGRNHRFVAALARFLFEQAFSGGKKALAARCGAIRTRAVKRLTALLLLRPRFQLRQSGRVLLAEEVLVAGWEAFTERWLDPAQALALLTAEPVGNISLSEKRELVSEALKEIERMLGEDHAPNGLRRLLQKRAEELEEAHRRVRQSVGQPVRGFKVEPQWPPDLLGVLILQPSV